MGIARSTYYDQPEISIDDTALVETMGCISAFESYGYPRDWPRRSRFSPNGSNHARKSVPQRRGRHADDAAHQIV